MVSAHCAGDVVFEREVYIMGVQGLRKFIETLKVSCGLNETVGPSPKRFDHVLFDMNCIVHSCFTREQQTDSDTLAAVIAYLHDFLTQRVSAGKTIVFAFDGPGPQAKLLTQRMRRRKLRHLDTRNCDGFSDLSITAGSVFLLKVEQALAKAVMQWNLRPRDICIIGSAVPGEGEAKISQALAAIAGSLRAKSLDETVVIIGNDIDLVLTALGATAFHNISVVNPQSLSCIDIGVLLHRWLNEQQYCSLEELPSFRVDFVYLFMLNGGDHYSGLGDVATSLFHRYRGLRQSDPTFCLINAGGWLNVPCAKLLFSTQQYDGAAEAEDGRMLLQASIWGLIMTITGRCTDVGAFFHFAGLTTLCNVKAALQTLKMDKLYPPRSEEDFLSPLETFSALMPTKEALPSCVREVIKRAPQFYEKLQYAKTAPEMVEATRKLVGACREQDMTPVERFLTQHGVPVDISGSLMVDLRKEKGTKKFSFLAFGYGASQQQLQFHFTFPLVPKDALVETEAEKKQSKKICGGKRPREE